MHGVTEDTNYINKYMVKYGWVVGGSPRTLRLRAPARGYGMETRISEKKS